MKQGNTEPHKAADLVSAFFRSVGINDEKGYSAFFSRWESIVGTDLAAHSRVVDVKNGSIVVQFDHPGWMQVFHASNQKILKRINEAFPKIEAKTIHMRLVESLADDAPAETHLSSRRSAAQHEEPRNEKSADVASTNDDPIDPMERIESESLRSSLESLRRSIDKRVR